MPPARGTGRNLGTDTQRLPPVAADDAAALLLPDPEVVLGSVPLSAILLTSARLIALTRPEPEKLSSSAGIAAPPSRVFTIPPSLRPLGPVFRTAGGRGGEEGVVSCCTWGAPHHKKKKTKSN